MTRIKTFIQNQKITTPFKVITTNPKADRFFSDDQRIKITADKDMTKSQLRDSIQRAIADFNVEEWYIDTFPCGILGELDTSIISPSNCHYLARRIHWDAYRMLVNNQLKFKRTFCFEPLTPDHQKFIQSSSQEVLRTTLRYPSPQPISHKVLHLKKPLWLIVHTTYKEEINLLLDHAMDIANIQKCTPQFVVLTDQPMELPDDIILMSNQNAIDWFPHAHKIISAAGFNTWYQLASWRGKHICLPFKRRYDDQFWRSTTN
ncbi:MAG: hypothetical protein AAF551_11365 [Bacteroidota bacterium]